MKNIKLKNWHVLIISVFVYIIKIILFIIAQKSGDYSYRTVGLWLNILSIILFISAIISIFVEYIKKVIDKKRNITPSQTLENNKKQNVLVFFVFLVILLGISFSYIYNLSIENEKLSNENNISMDNVWENSFSGDISDPKRDKYLNQYQESIRSFEKRKTNVRKEINKLLDIKIAKDAIDNLPDEIHIKIDKEDFELKKGLINVLVHNIEIIKDRDGNMGG